MTKRDSIIVSILLILASIVCYVLMKNSTTKIDTDFIDFFSGLLFATGFFFLIQLPFKKKK